MADWTTLGTREYSITVNEAVSLSGSIDFLLNGNPVSGEATGGINSTLTAEFSVSAEVHGNATKYVKFSLVVDGKEVGSKVVKITSSGTYSDKISYQFTEAGKHNANAIIYEGDNMTDWTQLAEKGISVTITAPVKNPTIQLSLNPTEAKPTDTVNATMAIDNPNGESITGMVYLGYVDESTKQFVPKFSKQVTVPANQSTTVTTSFTPQGWGLGQGTYSIGAQGKFTINGNNVVVSSNPVTLTVEGQETVLAPQVSVTASPNPASVGQEVTISATVKNPNNQSGKLSAILEITYPNGTKKSLTPDGWSNLTVPANGTAHLSYGFTPEEAGNYTVEVKATLTIGQIQKSAESNALTLSVNNQNAPKPPTLVLSAQPTTVVAGKPINVSITVENMAEYPITSGRINVLVDGEKTATIDVPEIDAGKEKTVSTSITLNTLGKHSISSEGTFTINNQTVNAKSNSIPVTVIPPQGKNFKVVLSYPNSVTAGSGFTLSVSVMNTGEDPIVTCYAVLRATQYDEEGNPVSTVGPVTMKLGGIKAGESSSASTLIMSKDVPGQIAGTVEVTATYPDNSKLNKGATFTVQVTSPSGGGSGEAEGEMSITTPLLIGAGLVGLLLITRSHERRERR